MIKPCLRLIPKRKNVLGLIRQLKRLWSVILGLGHGIWNARYCGSENKVLAYIPIAAYTISCDWQKIE